MSTWRNFYRWRWIEIAAFSAQFVAIATQAHADDGDDAAEALGFLILIIVGLAFYIAPTIVAFVRRHPNRWVIGVINVTLGGTGLGWLGSLVWACSAAHLSPSGSNGGESGLNLFVNDVQHVQIKPASLNADIEAVSAQLLRLKRLRDDGAITPEEYDELKRPLIQSL